MISSFQPTNIDQTSQKPLLHNFHTLAINSSTCRSSKDNSQFKKTEKLEFAIRRLLEKQINDSKSNWLTNFICWRFKKILLFLHSLLYNFLSRSSFVFFWIIFFFDNRFRTFESFFDVVSNLLIYRNFTNNKTINWNRFLKRNSNNEKNVFVEQN